MGGNAVAILLSYMHKKGSRTNMTNIRCENLSGKTSLTYLQSQDEGGLFLMKLTGSEIEHRITNHA